jgi:phosphoribosylaminoimidazolecarboxamide formyltransferase/IMP cyclohydrolase
MRAIISVSDKTGAAEFAKGLVKLGYEIFSTGHTKKAIEEAGVPVTSVSEITGFPEILDGRVKTLHPMVHGGILARRDLPAHMKELEDKKIEKIDLVAVNLYPFVQTVAKEGVTLTDALENIDIGGPAMIRASAKNFPGVIIVVDPADYPLVLEKLQKGDLTLEERKRLAQKAFQHTAIYDTAIAQYLRQGEVLPEELTIAMKKRYGLRYGENPHQKAAFYAELAVGAKQNTSITWAKQLGGKELSFNNILDADAAWGAAVDFAAPTVAVIKHTNPCGLASHKDIAEAYRRAFSGDEVAAYGGIVAANRTVTLAMAEAMRPVFYEIIIAPSYEPTALKLLQEKKKDLRILEAELPPGYDKEEYGYIDYRRVRGGFLVQTSDSVPENKVDFKIVTKRAPTTKEKEDLLFAWRAVKHVKSNAILLAKDRMITGMGAGQPSRIVSAQIAGEKAGEKARGSVLASDAMFPFADVVEHAAKLGVTAIIQPGGSIRDQESIDAADKHNITMVLTGERHFRH